MIDFTYISFYDSRSELIIECTILIQETNGSGLRVVFCPTTMRGQPTSIDISEFDVHWDSKDKVMIKDW